MNCTQGDRPKQHAEGLVVQHRCTELWVDRTITIGAIPEL